MNLSHSSPRTPAHRAGISEDQANEQVEPRSSASAQPLAWGDARQVLWGEWNNTHFPLPTCPLHTLFEAQVARSPNAPALWRGDQVTSYLTLNTRANSLAFSLYLLEVEPETVVGVCVDRSPDLITALLAVLKAGAAFLLLDPQHPRERLAFMCDDSKVDIIVTQAHLLEEVTAVAGQRSIVTIEDHAGEQRLQGPPSRISPGHTAYTIYTSGTTGHPKAVRIDHRGAVNLHVAQMQAFAIRPEDRVLQFASPNFDAYIFEVIMALLSGATLVLPTPGDTQVGPPLLRMMKQQEITLAVLTPSVWSALPADPLPALRIAMAAGEPCPAELVQKWSAPGRRFFNLYGPAEAGVWATCAECLPDGSKPSIGRAIVNKHVYILDAALQPVAIGTPGQMAIGGEGIGRYFRRPDLNREKFLPDPFQPGQTWMYLTGDLGCWKPDGKIEFLGRMDEQIKLHGQRIEPGEIEEVLSSAPGVEACAVLLREGRLVAYLVAARGGSYNELQIRPFLQQHLPSFMIPAVFVALESLPRTINDKVDRRALASLPPPQAQVMEVARQCPPAQSMPEAALVAPVEQELRALFARLLQIPGEEPVPADLHFTDAGGDSLSVAALLAAIEERWGVSLPLEEVYERLQPMTLAPYIVSRRCSDSSPELAHRGIERSVHP
jgi:amino acid adenylation domain-containing protein